MEMVGDLLTGKMGGWFSGCASFEIVPLLLIFLSGLGSGPGSRGCDQGGL
jgi:hypothetical protein